MEKKLKRLSVRLIVFVISAVMIFMPNTCVIAAEPFLDVPSGHWAYEYVQTLRELGVTSGIGGNLFGLGLNIKKSEFVKYLTFMLGLQNLEVSGSSFSDNADPSQWYYQSIEAAVRAGIVVRGGDMFYPDTPITRGEMAVMIVRALGLASLAESLGSTTPPFSDVSRDRGYVTIAYDLGIISGVGGGMFAPDNYAKREEAAKMMVIMNTLLHNKINETNAFYAVSSYSQVNYAGSFDSVSYGWERLRYSDGQLSLTSEIPDGYEEPYGKATGKRLLLIFVSDEDSQRIVNDAVLRETATGLISGAVSGSLSGLTFDGCVIDFETLKGAQTAANFTELIKSVKNRDASKLIYVAVHPKRIYAEYYDGYDYQAICAIADKVILMAHDYNTKKLSQEEMEAGIVMTPGAPIVEVYYALKAAKEAGDISKIMLQINFAAVQWKLSGGKVVNETPYTPGYDALYKRIDTGAVLKYDEKSESPYITFSSEDGYENVVFYENERSVEAKIKLAELFGVRGLSFWRLGNMPDFAVSLR